MRRLEIMIAVKPADTREDRESKPLVVTRGECGDEVADIVAATLEEDRARVWPPMTKTEACY